jgi:sialate O-acetylesterase
VCLLVPAAAALPADLRLPAVLGDHMVVQRDATTRMWGWAGPGDAVSVSASWGGAAATRAGADGAWSVALETPGAGGPHTLTVTSADETLVLDDVLSGDVWVCSGQSNMEWSLWHTSGGPDDVAAAAHPGLRLFDVAHQIATAERDDCGGAWQVCSPEAARDFSAIGYHFGARLHAELGVPIGLLGTSWGGTRAEAWTSAGTIQAGFPEFHADLAAMADRAAGGGGEPALAELQAAFWNRLETTDAGMTGGWMRADFDAADWRRAPVPGPWSAFGEGDFDGCLWYRTAVDVPAAWSGRMLVLELGPVDDMDLTWFNGALVGESRADGLWSTPRVYAIPAGLARAGANAIAVCAIDSGGVGLLGNDAMRLRLADDAGGAESVALSGEWRYRTGSTLDELGGFPRAAWMNQHRPAALFNGMVAPLLPFAIKGAIWYQGESNREQAAQYRRLFPALISDWRRRFGVGDFPFYFVQLAPFAYPGDTGQLSELREAQALTLALKNTGMAVTMDVGNPADIHPRDKRTVAERLARIALANTYGKDVACEGPAFERIERAGAGLRVVLGHADGLTSRGAAPRCFTLAGADRVFHPAEARIDGANVIVTSAAVPDPVAVRFAWAAADEPNLWNGAGLPAGSFRSDDWPPTGFGR